MWSSPSFVILSILIFLFTHQAYGRRSVGTLASSVYGIAGGKASWEWTADATSTVNGINVTTETVCAGSIDTGSGTPACDSSFVFLYQIPSGPDNLVVTLSGLSRFPFISKGPPLGFGVLLCDPSPDQNMLCTQNMTASDVASLNIGWDVIDGDLILTIPTVPAAKTLTIYVAEEPLPPGQIAPTAPVISLGGAVVVPPIIAFGAQESNSSGTPVTITVANSDDFTTSLNIKSTSKPNDFALDGSCATLAPGISCPLFLAFTPTSAGNLSGALTVTDDSPPGSEAVRLNGIGTTPGVTLSPTSLAFGTQAVGISSDPLSVTLSNSKTNKQSLQVIGRVLAADPVTGTPDFTETDNCSAPIDPGNTCTFQITFTPTISGPIESSITLTDNSTDGTHTIVLNGNATEANTAISSSASLIFGSQTSGTTSAPQTVTITNASAIPLAVVAVNTTAGFATTTDNCSGQSALAAGKSCTVSVAFQPALGAHPYTGTLTVANDAIGGTLVIPFTGTSLAAPAAAPTFSPAAGSYSSTQTVSISDATAGAAIYYTSDGTTPTTGSTLYSGPITVSKTQTIEAIATSPDYVTSAVASALYTINLPPPSFAIAGTPVSLSAGEASANTSTITVTPAGGFTGSVALSALISSSPANAVNLPTFSFGSTNPVSISGTSSATATLTITTTAATVSALHDPNVKGNGWLAATCASLAFIVILWVPRRERRCLISLALLLLLAAVINVSVACGGGGGQPNTGHTHPATTAGAYTITVTGASASLSETGTVSLTVK
jgi:hypothetical protein